MSTSRYHHGDLRNTLLTAAERMIDADVTRRFSLRELAREAGVSHGAPYRHFADRDELLEALAARWMSDFVTAQERAVDNARDARDSVEAAGIAYVTWAAAHPSRFTTIFDPALNHGTGAEGVGAQAARHERLLQRLVADAVADGSLTGPPATIGQHLWSIAHGLAGLTILGHIGLDSVPDILRQAIR